MIYVMPNTCIMMFVYIVNIIYLKYIDLERVYIDLMNLRIITL